MNPGFRRYPRWDQWALQDYQHQWTFSIQITILEILAATGGVDSLNMAFYQKGDLESDKVWDIWRIEGPAFVWHFRGAPHVHAYINIGQKKTA